MASLTVSPVGGISALKAWRTYKLFCNTEQNVFLLHVVRPVVAELLREGVIDRFFFVRCAQKGPHLRVRWRLTHGQCEAIAEEKLQNFTAEFCAGRSAPANEKSNMQWRRFPMRAEVKRYGGTLLSKTRQCCDVGR